MLLIIHFHHGVCVLDRQSHLYQILRQCLLSNTMFDRLCKNKLNESKTDFGLLRVELLVTTKFEELILIVLYA